MSLSLRKSCGVKKKTCVTQLYVADPDFFPIWTGKHLKRLRERITNSKSIEHNFAQLSVLSKKKQTKKHSNEI